MSVPRTVISLTSIPPRFAGLGPVLETLLAQGADEVRLTLPCSYVRFPGPVEVPDLPAGVRLIRAEVDHGPALKWLPVLAEQANAPEVLVICDDDWIYGPGWMAELTRAARPGIASTGQSFGTHRLDLGAGRIVQGFSGVCLRPAEIFAIGDVPSEAWGVDDIWLSALIAASGITPVDVPAARASARPAGNEAAPLQDTALEGQTRAERNRACAALAARTFGIWR